MCRSTIQLGPWWPTSGKGVSSALRVAAAGRFLNAPQLADMENMMARLSSFLHERTEGGKYATMFTLLTRRPFAHNAGHCAPSCSPRRHEYLEATPRSV